MSSGNFNKDASMQALLRDIGRNMKFPKAVKILLPSPTIEERISIYEKKFEEGVMPGLNTLYLTQIIKLRTKKLIKDYCE